MVFVLKKPGLHVAVTNLAGDAAQFFEAAVDLPGGGAVGGKAFDRGEELELGLDAAGGGAQLVDGFGGWGGNSYGQRGLEAFGLFAQLFHGSCGG